DRPFDAIPENAGIRARTAAQLGGVSGIFDIMQAARDSHPGRLAFFSAAERSIRRTPQRLSKLIALRFRPRCFSNTRLCIDADRNFAIPQPFWLHHIERKAPAGASSSTLPGLVLLFR